MSAKRAAVYSGAGLLLVAWLSSAGGVMRQADPPAPARPVGPTGTDIIAADVQAQTERLKNRLASAPAPQEPFRNPFMFASRAAPERRPGAARTDTETLAPVAGPPLEPAIELIGVAEAASANGVVRTAIISALGGELFLVKEGETLASRYRVGVVGADAVELTDLLTSSVRRLALRE